jgi:hypothetical protein
LKNQPKHKAMQKFAIFFVISAMVIAFACKKDEQTERFKYLTTPVWESDSLLANGVDASGEGQSLANFKGDAKFNTDGTGYFGVYTGRWKFAQSETEIVIITNELPAPVSTNIVELTQTSLKVTTTSPITQEAIRMTFKAK